MGRRPTRPPRCRVWAGSSARRAIRCDGSGSGKLSGSPSRRWNCRERCRTGATRSRRWPRRASTPTGRPGVAVLPEAAEVLGRAAPDEGRVAYLAARACEVPQRWPGSIRGAPPTRSGGHRRSTSSGAPRFAAGRQRGADRLLGVPGPAGCSATRFPNRRRWRTFGRTRPRGSGCRGGGSHGLARPARQGLSTLRTRHGSRWGYYNRMFPLWERRAELLPVSDRSARDRRLATRLGAWCLFELGRYPEALGIAPTTASSRSRGGVPTWSCTVRAWRVAIPCIGWRGGTRRWRNTISSGSCWTSGATITVLRVASDRTSWG